MLTAWGDMLVPPQERRIFSRNDEMQGPLLNDYADLKNPLGVHENCPNEKKPYSALIFRHTVTIAPYDIIVCALCELRIMIPKEIRTYGSLREYCHDKIKTP